MASTKNAASSSRASASMAPPPPPPTIIHEVRYTDWPISFDHYFGHSGGMDYGVVYGLRRERPLTQDSSSERAMIIHRGKHSVFRAIITDADTMALPKCEQIRKPDFLFGDRIQADDDMVCVEDPRVLDQVDDRFLYLPNMKRMYPLSYFQSVSCSRRLRWDLTEEVPGISTGHLFHHTVHIAGHNCDVQGLKPGEVHSIVADLEKSTPANTFIRQFIAAQGEFPAKEFRAPGWLYSPDGGWWARLVDFVLDELRPSLILSGVGTPVEAMRNGVIQSPYNFFAILENYNPDSCTFFTPVGELGFALHEMHAMSGLSLGERPYEEFVPGADELSMLRTTQPAIYATLWEVMCHFHICAQLTGLRSGGVKQMCWAEYLFQNLHSKDRAVTRLSESSPRAIAARLDALGAANFGNFHYQAGIPISDTALLAGFLMIWLKRCVVPSRPADSILVDVVYPAVLIAHGQPISLLSAMVSCLQHGLRELTSEFTSVKEVGPVGDKRLKTPQPRVPLPYTYLMAWFVMHCPSLVTGISDTEVPVSFLQRLKSAQWTYSYIVLTRDLLLREDSYKVFCCSSSFGGVDQRSQSFMDVATGGFTSLPGGVFRWLLVIRPGYLVFRLGERCIIEPYLPCRFARQFGYDQLYVGSPNPELALVGNLYEGARAWYYWTAGDSATVFRLPSRKPKCQTVLGYCNWYSKVSQVPWYDIHHSCLKDIKEMYEARKDSKKTRIKGVDEYLLCEQEASRVGKSQQEDVTTEAPGEGTAEKTTPNAEEAARATETSRERAAGKRALNAEEAAQYDKRARRRMRTRPRSERRSKLMQGAIGPAPVICLSDDEESA